MLLFLQESAKFHLSLPRNHAEHALYLSLRAFNINWH